MYMSGRSLFSLTIEAARRITEQFDGKLRISYSGGATVYNIRALYDAGIWPSPWRPTCSSLVATSALARWPASLPTWMASRSRASRSRL